MPHLIYGGESDQLIKVRTVPLGGAEVVLDIPDRVRTHEDEVRARVPRASEGEASLAYSVRWKRPTEQLTKS